MVPEDLAEDAMRWLDEKIPPEGLPIWNAEEEKTKGRKAWHLGKEIGWTKVFNVFLDWSRF